MAHSVTQFYNDGNTGKWLEHEDNKLYLVVNTQHTCARLSDPIESDITLDDARTLARSRGWNQERISYFHTEQEPKGQSVASLKVFEPWFSVRSDGTILFLRKEAVYALKSEIDGLIRDLEGQGD